MGPYTEIVDLVRIFATKKEETLETSDYEKNRTETVGGVSDQKNF